MAGEYRVYDAAGKSLTGKDKVDRETARRVFMEEKRRTAGQKTPPTMIRQGQQRDLASRAE